MSGVGKFVSTVFQTGDQNIDGVLSNVRWGGTEITYSFPTSVFEYGGVGYSSDNEISGFFPASAGMQTATHFGLNTSIGPTASAGFSIEGFTNMSIRLTTNADANLRIAQSTAGTVPTAQAYFPGTSRSAGDNWFGAASPNWGQAQAGNYEWITVLHELGHSMGLEHAHDTGQFGAVPSNRDAMEYSIMSYRSYINGPTTAGYSNETFGYAQTFMMLDIAALQHMYGADYTTNSGNTTYKWSPGSGVTLVNGQAGISPGANRIFMTVWDGGGLDIYDLQDYTTDMTISLEPGAFSVLSATQIANLGNGNNASGNVYNALMHMNDARSLIEAAFAGSGNDNMTGNQANNVLYGKQGNDTMTGLAGNDRMFGGQGNDVMMGGDGNDSMLGEAGADRMLGGAGNDLMKGGWMSDWMYGEGDNDVMLGEGGNDRMFGGTGMDLMYGGAGTDRMFGAAGNDFLSGGADNDTLLGEAGNDFLSGESGNDSLTGGLNSDRFIFRNNFGQDTITDYDPNDAVERIDLSRVNAITDQADLDANHIFQVGANVEIRDGTNIITVLNVTVAQLQDGNDFIF